MTDVALVSLTDTSYQGWKFDIHEGQQARIQDFEKGGEFL